VIKTFFLLPHDGLCNRLRAIASARRICQACSIQLKIFWEWGQFERLFDTALDFDIISDSSLLPANARIVHHPRAIAGGTYQSRLVKFVDTSALVLHSAWLFGYEGEETPITERGLSQWLPRPSTHVRDRVAAYMNELPKPLAGLHVRQTDNSMAIRSTPEWVYLAEARRLTDLGYSIFLACDNAATEARLRASIKYRVYSLDKFVRSAVRWPRRYSTEEDVELDMVDLFMLSSCNLVVGSIASCYSRLAMIYNGGSTSYAIWLNAYGKVNRRLVD
jgi:hypothetical protein